jgi:glycosyltransferase involved in cell wall biosynthesis
MKHVSVIVTAYNVERYIYATVRSVLSQTLDDIEIIVVDDGSTDGTRQILEVLSKTDHRVTLNRKDNGGVSSARNCGLATATGEYILFVDGDDLLLPTACDSLYRKAVSEDADIVVADYLERSEHGGGDCRKTGGAFTTLHGSEFGRLLLEPFFTVAIWNKMVRRKLYCDDGIRFPAEISMAEDLVTLFELCCRARKVVKLDEPTIIYIRRAGSLVSTLSPHHYTVTRAMEGIERLIQQYYGSSGEISEDFHMACYYHVMYARVIHIHTYGGFHKKLYDWYTTKRFERKGTKHIHFVRRTSAKQMLMACGYGFSYRAGVTVSRTIDLAKLVVSKCKMNRI